jgi:ABC-2 type transport system ATP-binding protein
VMGLDAPSGGSVTIDGRPYASLRRPMFEVGAMLEATAIHEGRSAYNHLLWVAQSNGIGKRRVEEVLGIVGLSKVGKRRAGGFSMGMGQRLGIGVALLGDPELLIFDEPVNGLDPEGIVWIRNLMRSLAAEGRTVFVSSHLMSEMALTADHVIVIGRGRLLAESSVDDLIQGSSGNFVRVRSLRNDKLAKLLIGAGASSHAEADGALAVTGIEASAIGDLAAVEGIALHELSPQEASLEEAYMQLTHDSVEYRADVPGPATPPIELSSGKVA